MFEDNIENIQRIMATEMAVNTSGYSYLDYINKNVIPVVNEFSEVIKPFCQNVLVEKSINSIILRFSTKILSSNIISIEVTPDCKMIHFDLSSGSNFYFDNVFEIYDPTQNDQGQVWHVLMKLLELRLEHIQGQLDNPDILSDELHAQTKAHQGDTNHL